jgi:hypothetical protein
MFRSGSCTWKYGLAMAQHCQLGDDLWEIEDGHVELTLEEIICHLIDHIVNEVRFLRFAAC